MGSAAPRRGLSRRALLILLAVVALVVLLASPGSGSAFFAAITVAHVSLSAGTLALLWVLGALGLGRVFGPLLGPIDHGPSRLALQLALGVGAALTLAHLLGVLGLMSVSVAWGPTVIGLALLVAQVRRAGGRGVPRRRVSRLVLLGLPAIALLLVAGSNPPGGLWASEANAYDVLSYHLMLPREWIAGGAIVPLEHNVYSYLPSYVEAAYAQLALMVGAGTREPPLGLGEGIAIHGAAFLHALFAIGTAFALSAHAHRILFAGGRRVAAAGADESAPPALAALTFLAVPWVVVVGSLPYNEMAVTLCFAGALIAAFEEPLRPVARAGLGAFLVGVACSAKPTALYLVAPPMAIALAFAIPARHWVSAGLVAIPAGIAPLVPWLVRNWLASGNPVFPAATSVFGTAHWSADQVTRWQDAHHPPLSALDRLARLFDTSHGVVHSQWSILFPVAVLAAGVAMAHKGTRRLALVSLSMLLAKCVAWLLVGHLQSRFLISAAVPASILVGLASATRGRGRSVSALREALHPARVLPVAAVIVLIASSVAIFLRQNDGAPNALLVGGVPALNGAAFETASLPVLDDPGARAFYESRPPALAVNNLERIGDVARPTILLVGDATPLYLGRGPNRVIYATTWDTNPLAEALRAHSGSIPDALDALRSSRGVTHVLVNLAELHRLRASGYLDPVLGEETVLRLLRDHTRILLRWPESGVVLAELPMGGG